MNKHWLDDLKVGCKFLFNLVKFIEMDGDFEDKLKLFDDAFERNGVVDL